MTDAKIREIWVREWRSAWDEVPLWDAVYARWRLRDPGEVVVRTG